MTKNILKSLVKDFEFSLWAKTVSKIKKKSDLVYLNVTEVCSFDNRGWSGVWTGKDDLGGLG